MMVVQGLGRLDVSLVEEDQSFVSEFDKNEGSIEEALKLTDRFTLSYLWVLGAYELVRSICQRLDKNKDTVSPDVAQSFVTLKKQFNRIRVPLAKMEAASGYKTDSHIAYPAIDFEKGIAWQLNQTDFITRKDLADQLLAVLEDARRANPKLNVAGDGAQQTVQRDGPASGGSAG